MKKPIWIEVEGGDLFSGHQGHWMDCYFANGIESEIRSFCEDNNWQYTICEMTDEELTEHSEAVGIQKCLMETYGEV